MLRPQTTENSFFNYSYIKFVFKFQFGKSLIKLLLFIIIIIIIIYNNGGLLSGALVVWQGGGLKTLKGNGLIE